MAIKPPSGLRPLVRKASGMAGGPPRVTGGVGLGAPASAGGVRAIPKVPTAAPVKPYVPPTPPAGAPTSAPAAPTTAPPPDLSGDNWKAYLTPDQLAAMNTLATNTGASVTADQNRIADAQDSYARNDAEAALTHDQGVVSANDAMAGRGLYLSSIRDNDLTDISRTLVNYRATATANLASLTNEANAAIATLNTNWNTAVLGYEGDAASQVPTPVGAPAPAAPPPISVNTGGLPGLPTAPGVTSRSTPINTAPSAANRAPIAAPKPAGAGFKPPAFPVGSRGVKAASGMANGSRSGTRGVAGASGMKR